ncbi:uncharacterized protein LOC135849797 isoform X3 [Planococcus citri]|uniref:uncharacterized protein LOC135849797 isoform X3 n=1 Tax=Planococcus citri TaxID=170843 RepID=UPI0031F97B07
MSSYPPSMVHKSGNRLVVRSVVSGDKLFGTSEETEDETSIGNGEVTIKRAGAGVVTADEALSPECSVVVDQDEELPQCKVKRNYACSSCSYYTQNPRYYLHHLKNVHKEKIRIYECPHCLYASKHSQKLQRHIHMVHVMGKRKMLIKAKSSPNRKNPSTGGGIGKTSAMVAMPELTATLLSMSREDDKKPCEPVHRQLPDDDDLTSSSAAATVTAIADETEMSGGGDDGGDFSAGSITPVAEIREEITNESPSFASGAGAADVPLKCSLCPFSSRNPNLVTRHERLVHLKKKFYRCTKCDYITHMKARFTKHVKYHSMPMIKCDMCDFRTPYKWNLDRHNKNHFANGAFKCSQCNFTADIKQSLTVHEMNHHVPPVNQNGAAGMTIPTPAKRRCRVGASDIIAKQQENAANSIDPDLDDLELLRMERESLPNADTANANTNGNANAINVDTSADALVDEPAAAQMAAVEITMVKPNVPSGARSVNLNSKNPTAAAYLNGTLKPEDVILTKNGSVYVKKFKCRVCHYKAAWESEMIRHEVRVHGLEAPSKKKSLPRPIPNLIPIQGGGNGGGKNTSNDNSPAKSILDEFTGPLTENDLNDMCVKSCANSSLSDFVSLIGADEIKTERLKDLMTMFSSANEAKESKNKDRATPDSKRSNADSSSDTSPSDPAKKLPDSFKKKNATFFDRLKEKLMVGAGENGNLVCWCGHKSKCLSESLMHQKQHSENNEKNEKSTTNGPVISGAELSSTRCQHCRQRCKTSSDLYVHLQSCPEVLKKGSGAGQANGTVTLHAIESEDVEDDCDMEAFADENEEEFVETSEPEIKEESKVFVWNNFSEEKEDFGDEFADEENRSKSPASEASLVGYEIAPGIGSVMPNNNEDSNDRYKNVNASSDVTNPDIAVKKYSRAQVFKCPECTFWASTASRFHVHIVSHLNVKPFGCSVCPYQSKWKWDVTKHIRLKKERDATHEHAEMRTIDVETGRRNYTKYNKFLTFMRVHHEPDSDTNGDASSKTTSDVSIRPLPQLHPANPNVSLKRIHEAGDDSDIPKKKTPSEKKMWKCKKCKFRNTNRNVVLAHVKEHYTAGGNAQNANESNVASYSQEARNQTEGHNVNQSSSHLISSGDPASQNSREGNYKCKHCVFETDCPSTFVQHNRHHEHNPSAHYKCCFCPFYANDKLFMLNHIKIHGVKNVEESLPLITHNVPEENENDKLENGIEESDFNEPIDSGAFNGSMVSTGGDEPMEVFKRFKCTSCPYVTNNKSQYLYHRQFHRLRGAPFKCNVCTYNVTKRHLLHQHLKIHGIKRAQFKNCINDAVEKETTDGSAGAGLKLNTDIDTTRLPDIPLVWVFKSGSLTKMFKCRHCPHVNLRKSNIHEHEKMHFDRIQRSPNGSVNPNSSVHRCTECNYVCNNAGALASHFKVHQGAFGQICALADPRRSDESQCKEITKLIKEDERFQKKAAASPRDQPDDLKRRLSAVAASIEIASPARAHETVDATITTFESALPEQRSNPMPDEKKVLHFCNVCPARFLYLNELDSHSRFHSAHHAFKCNSCTYSAPQQPHLSAHRRVHSQEYSDKTNQLCMTYETSKDYARPKTTFIPDKPGFPGLGWIVMLASHKKDDSGSTKPKAMTKQYSCHKCPAQFFKSVALQHHLTLHGGKDPYQCRSCDYRVKTYGNLIKHEAVHGLEPRMKAKALKSKKQSGNVSIPCSGTELFQHRTEQIAKEQTTPAGPVTTTVAASSSLSVDPEFGILMHGSPEFVYPTTLKNGKMKDKRYKCHKCPSAFEKREQYKVHLQLHGAKFKYKCEKCDYAVKYYANYAQHMRKHDYNEKRLSERRASIVSKASEESGTDSPMDIAVGAVGLVNGSAAATANDRLAYGNEKKDINDGDARVCNGKASKTLHISIADQQAVVLMQQKITDNVNLADQLHRCYYCPYSHQRKDAVENHERCHFNNKGSYVCEFCNYTVPQPHFLREHQKLHFGSMKGIKAEAFMKCDRLEIWMETEEGKVLIFKDNGSAAKDESRFEPNLSINEEDSEYKKMYVDVKTGEEFTPKKQSPNPDELLDSCSDKDKILPKPFNLSEVGVKLSESSSSSSSMSSSYSSPNHVKDEEEDDEEEIIDDEMFDEVKKEPENYEEMLQDDEVIDDEVDAADEDVSKRYVVFDEDDSLADIEESSIMAEPGVGGIKEEEESYLDAEADADADADPDPDDENTEVGLTSDLEYNDTDMDTETENTNMENSHIDKCADTQENPAQTKEEEEEATRQNALVPEEEAEFSTAAGDDETRLSGEDSDSEDSDSSSSSSCSSSSSSSSSKSSKEATTTNPTSNTSTDDEDSKGDVIKKS